ncbi:E3 ubiquitin-protein ligase RNFT1 [Camelus dromedarius]|uniref:E3 ubiquitin-protein ligase RNFT1 n=1 Tax=Camelus dromedarius TaxID=9838 RepID=A0A5N4D3X0_CAMDR|nr:E3 ubiquitin-protein ligase RNFT1 [Camelus dromedarius]
MTQYAHTRQSPKAKKSGSRKKYPRVMQANCSQLHSPSGAAGSEDAAASQCVQTRLTGEASCLYCGDVHIQMNSMLKECAENTSSGNTRSGVHSCTHGCAHSRFRSHSHSEARQPDDTNTESGDHGSSSSSEFRYLFKWLQKSIPYILILGVKLFMQHITGRLLDFFGHLRTFRRVLRIFFTRPSYGVAASKRQCSDAYGICSVCQAEFQKPILLICQHIFCEECITLWLNREKTCPLCRTVISDHVYKWKDGATSSQLQIY